MPAIVVPHAIAKGPGYLYRAVLGTPLPGTGSGGVVTGSKFTDAWDAAWIPVGVTRDGSQFSYEVSTEDTIVAEYLDPLDTDETARNIGVAFDLAHITNRSYMMAMNGGTTSTVSGTAATTLTKVAPPVLGASVKIMLGWESQDGTQRTFFYQALQSGNIQWSNSKAPNFQSLPLTFKVTQPSSGDPFNIFLAGVDRIAAA